MTTQTKTERAAQSIRGYPLTINMNIRCNPKTVRTAEALGIITIGKKRSEVLCLSSWIDQRLNEEIEKVLQKLQNRKDHTEK